MSITLKVSQACETGGGTYPGAHLMQLSQHVNMTLKVSQACETGGVTSENPIRYSYTRPPLPPGPAS